MRDSYDGIAYIDWNPAATEADFKAALLAQPDHKAVVLIGSVSGGIHQKFAPLIASQVKAGIPVFLVSGGTSQDGGISKTAYAGMNDLLSAGVTPIERGNRKNIPGILDDIQEQIDAGKIGIELRDAISRLF